MKRFFLLFLLIGCAAIQALSQKPVIDTSVLGKWPSVSTPAISPDGEYVCYTINNKSADNATLIVQSTDGTWKIELARFKKYSQFFSNNSRQLIFQRKDTLCLLTLGTDHIDYISNIESFRQPNGIWLAYRLKGEEKELVLLNLLTSAEQRFKNVTSYLFDNNGKAFLLKTVIKENDKITIALQWVPLPGKPTIIWTTEKSITKSFDISNFAFDADARQLCFMVQGKQDTQSINSIWYYKSGMDKAVLRISNQSTGLDAGFCISNSLARFSSNGKYIFFSLQRHDLKPNPQDGAVQVEVWSYKDIFLQSMQPDMHTPRFAAIMNAAGGPVLHLEQDNENLVTGPEQIEGDIVLLARKKNTVWWKSRSLQATNNTISYRLLSLENGHTISLGKPVYGNFSFSPKYNKYLICYDRILKGYYSYDIATGKRKCISAGITTRLDNEYEYSQGYTACNSVGIAGWLTGDVALLVYDNYDIWQLDPTGIKQPVNVTNGYGQKHRIKFRIVYKREALKGIDAKEQILLTAFSTETKYNGFYHMYLRKNENPAPLTFGPYIYYHDDSQYPNASEAFNASIQPLKAVGANTWVIKRQSATEAPNFFLTNDFKDYRSLSDLQPQQAYNWLTAELVNYRQLEGTPSQGILYKPENFDPSKKYPLLFLFYEQLSFTLFQYQEPNYSTDRINIPWFVSHGYLVFLPDIHYRLATISGKTVGEWAYNSVVAAAKHLSGRKYVDASKMGIQGHSFSGFETNWIVTHTGMFAAASEAAGTSDLIRSYLSLLNPNGKLSGDKQEISETGQGRIGATLWQRPDLFIRASPVLKADQVTTPLLIMHNKGDGSVGWEQGMEMYLALRRLDKRCWMLQYDDEAHVISNKAIALDYTLRLTQFFDHYLKNALPPKWLIEGIPANVKGIETGYKLDTSGKQP